jgi:hypothetical protein
MISRAITRASRPPESSFSKNRAAKPMARSRCFAIPGAANGI